VRLVHADRTACRRRDRPLRRNGSAAIVRRGVRGATRCRRRAGRRTPRYTNGRMPTCSRSKAAVSVGLLRGNSAGVAAAR
jgi:hypothetical protein